MSSMQFLTRSSLPRLAYYRIAAKNPGVVFLSGFKSNMNGEKALALEAFCDSAGYSFIRFDYTGCGSSEGNSEDCLLRDWKNDVLTVLDNLTTGPQILVGSSMGGWLMLLASLARPEKVAGMVGLATAADHFVTAFRQLPAEIRHFAKERFPSFPDLPPAMLWEKLTLSFNDKGLISALYSQLMSLEVQDLNKTETRWEDDFGMDLAEEYWAKTLNRVHSSSSCARLGLIQFEVLHGVHLSKVRLVDMYPGTDAGCDR
ncbi:palmitoyl-protein thioesterase ABHD10, mitochondrial-like isoform X1 [Hypanus sabinus]|uniref:palmitoyl-protein thioesterase ABHD10, mitochondrial-like isoform X1 n=1 Tax=Hypanus sabinus TaxID=79690 RepID=UPI0028C47E74|nr:palmitoyl-protein thioesterase ABHD10, mitochondrial-like isoform X1 [Hypanus sabinus]XP_059812781.1 palmitoyl-protein thioesterase ABHD10, mitochondrial-like isoform X1 [Hypanus sabinus]XP_059812782.1 palmitoyl-protein thioesterase ABHD10, mitochondrial-like isoform X1 [Hypanus sabinus]XP_059812784.1 palmitoyl-protein thioesterase ABHD10, mitochondrial-like isoform X1 [Hypanus sabinus]